MTTDDYEEAEAPAIVVSEQLVKGAVHHVKAPNYNTAIKEGKKIIRRNFKFSEYLRCQATVEAHDVYIVHFTVYCTLEPPEL